MASVYLLIYLSMETSIIFLLKNKLFHRFFANMSDRVDFLSQPPTENDLNKCFDLGVCVFHYVLDSKLWLNALCNNLTNILVPPWLELQRLQIEYIGPYIGPYIGSTSDLHRTYIEPTSDLHRTYIGPTADLHWTYIAMDLCYVLDRVAGRALYQYTTNTSPG